MAVTFTVSDVLYISTAIDDLLYMGDLPAAVEISRVCDEKNNESIRLAFSLKHGKSQIDISAHTALFYYLNERGEIVSSTSFTNDRITDTTGSFHQAFKYIRSIDRQQSQSLQVVDNTAYRTPVRLVEIN
jgi:hypothetical protein